MAGSESWQAAKEVLEEIHGRLAGKESSSDRASRGKGNGSADAATVRCDGWEVSRMSFRTLFRSWEDYAVGLAILIFCSIPVVVLWVIVHFVRKVW